MEKNTDLAYATLDYLREHPEEWNQKYYFCGTTMCFGGAVLLLAFGQEVRSVGLTRSFVDDYGIVAAKALGWTWAEAIHVFANYTEDFGVLERLVKEVLNGEISDEEILKEAQEILTQRRLDEEKARREADARRRREERERRDTETMNEIREIFPGLTGQQFDDLAGIFDTYFRWDAG